MAASISTTPTSSGKVNYYAYYNWIYLENEAVSHTGTLDGLYNTSYGNGHCLCSSTSEDRGYLAYDLGGVDFEVRSATVTFDIRGSGYDDTLRFYSVENYNSDDFNVLPEGDLPLGFGKALFDDLGDGSLYASDNFGTNRALYSFALNDDALAKINNGGEFLLGVTRAKGLFDTFPIYGEPLLILSDVPAVPVPAAAWLFGSALLGLSFIRRRREVLS